ncbi:hypothetical protein FF38_02835 [Lucilia cuprina]|uniref:Ig-like domain-containing protein n=1 Tax=Lucilia cuprina TaxID=7375 RepID=A0A0L0BWF3_LUCCU|nr:hypothetical protein FF38_02835 [Lucilia cuprina]
MYVKRPRAGDPFDTFPKNFWQEFSSPFTDTPEDEELEITETTTHEPFPFFADPFTTVNVSTQLGANVYLHCRVNDLQGKTTTEGKSFKSKTMLNFQWYECRTRQLANNLKESEN